MDDDSGPPRLSKRFSDNGKIVAPSGEVDYKTKAGTAWSHNFLNQKPWHPLSYPNQRRKWIAEQSHAQRQRRSEEVAREFAQEQEFFRQTALVSKKEKEKLEVMKAVSFMYVRPPGYNPESAKAAEIADEKRRAGETGDGNDAAAATSSSVPEAGQGSNSLTDDKKKNRPKDVFGRTLPTEEEFEVLKNAPRLDTGAPARVKPFAIEIRNVRCVRCGTFGHQSGDRECPLKDAIMPNDENRLKRDDPLTAIMAQTDSCEPLKWELKQRPGMSPPRGGFRQDDPNQQIVADDIFDEYGGFLSGGEIPSLLTSFTEKKSKKKLGVKSKDRKHSSASHSKGKIRNDNSSPAPRDFDSEKGKRMSKSKHERKKKEIWDSDGSNSSNFDRHHCRRKKSPSSDSDNDYKRQKTRRKHTKTERNYVSSSDHSDSDHCHHRRQLISNYDSDDERRKLKGKHKKERHQPSQSMSEDSDSSHHRRRRHHHHHERSHSSDPDSGHEPRKQLKSKHKKKERLHSYLSSSDNCDSDRRHRRRKRKTSHHPHASKGD